MSKVNIKFVFSSQIPFTIDQMIGIVFESLITSAVCFSLSNAFDFLSKKWVNQFNKIKVKESLYLRQRSDWHTHKPINKLALVDACACELANFFTLLCVAKFYANLFNLFNDMMTVSVHAASLLLASLSLGIICNYLFYHLFM